MPILQAASREEKANTTSHALVTETFPIYPLCLCFGLQPPQRTRLLHGRKPKLCASSSKISTQMLVHKIYHLSGAFIRSRGGFHKAIGTITAKGHRATATEEQFLENLGLMPSCVTSKRSHFSSSAQRRRARLPYQVVRIN